MVYYNEFDSKAAAWLLELIRPLAHGAAARVGRLRGYGNAIVAQCAQVFIESYLDGCGE